MLYVEVTREGGKLVSAKVVPNSATDDRVESRWDWKTYKAAAEVAAALGEKYQATDSGKWCSPRYDVIDLPQVGDEVSYAFNGDYYPCGKIKSISPGPAFWKIVAGPDFSGRDRVFWRRCRDGKPTGGAWVCDKTWSMIQGHVSKRNEEF